MCGGQRLFISAVCEVGAFHTQGEEKAELHPQLQTDKCT